MRWVFLWLCCAGPIMADTVVAARMIRPQTVLLAQDLAIMPLQNPGPISDPDVIIGLEARVTLYAGRAIRFEDLGPPTLVDRNQLITLIYTTGGLQIATEGRSLGRAGAGDRIRAMNLSSRIAVTGTVLADGTVSVSYQE